MYTNRGMLAMMTTSNIAANYAMIQKHLKAAEEGAIQMDPALFVDMQRWEQDIHAHIVEAIERVGRTNVCNDSMKL